MPKLVIELQKDCINPTISYATLFQKAYLIAHKLGQKEMADFLRKEIDGYKKEKEVPDFRYIDVIFKAMNPMRGWIPVAIPSNSLLNRYLRYPIFQPICEMESFLHSSGDIMVMSIPAELQELFISQSISKIPFEISAHFSKSQFKSILETGKRMISDWALDLEQKGVLGEEFEFSSKEKEIAKNMTIINNYGNINGSNIIGSMTNSSATINNNSFDFETLKQLITKIEADLENAKNIETEKAASLKEQITLLKKSAEEQNETSAIDLLKNIVAGAISSGIWTIGATVSNYLSSL